MILMPILLRKIHAKFSHSAMPTEFIPDASNARNAGLVNAHQTNPPGAAMEPLWMWGSAIPTSEQLYGLSGYPLQINVAGKTDIGCSKKKRTLIPHPVSKGSENSRVGSQTPRLLRRPSRPWKMMVSTTKNDGFCPDKMYPLVN